MFGHGVQLNFKGQETYKTTIGGIVSIIINVIMIAFAYRKLNTLYFRQDDKISMTIKNTENYYSIKHNEMGAKFMVYL